MQKTRIFSFYFREVGEGVVGGKIKEKSVKNTINEKRAFYIYFSRQSPKGEVVKNKCKMRVFRLLLSSRRNFIGDVY